MHNANMQAIKALGHSGTFLKLEIVKKSLELIGLLLVMKISVTAIAINMAVLTTLFTYVNAYPNIKLLNYTFKEQMNDILPPIGMSVFMAVIVFLIGKCLVLPDWILLIIQILSGSIIYTTIAFVSKNPEMLYIYSIIKNKFGHE